MITLKNGFHLTETRIRPTAVKAGLGIISKRAARQAWRNLCGVQGCTCGDTFGARDGFRLDIVSEDADGYLIRLPRGTTP